MNILDDILENHKTCNLVPNKINLISEICQRDKKYEILQVTFFQNLFDYFCNCKRLNFGQGNVLKQTNML